MQRDYILNREIIIKNNFYNLVNYLKKLTSKNSKFNINMNNYKNKISILESKTSSTPNNSLSNSLSNSGKKTSSLSIEQEVKVIKSLMRKEENEIRQETLNYLKLIRLNCSPDEVHTYLIPLFLEEGLTPLRYLSYYLIVFTVLSSSPSFSLTLK
jgi:hypothetical protein